MSRDKNLMLLLEGIELPDSAYESAKRRYEDLGSWFERIDSSLRDCDPHIFVQGSFALGTAIRPVKAGAEYDLDLSCKLRRRVDRSTHSQRDVKDMVGRELEKYRVYRRIEERLEAKNRCWRLNYKDELPFHIDVVPAVAAETAKRIALTLLIEQRGIDPRLAGDIASDALWITDARHPGYHRIQSDWLSSNPEGYVRWFVSRMEGTRRALRSEAKVDDVPVYRRKSSLQKIMQLLKRHRDVMFEKAVDSKPISIILTTIAGQAYNANQSLTESMTTALRAFDEFRRSKSDVVLNPVNPEENFADRWKSPQCQHLQLKENFHRWIVQAAADFGYFIEQSDQKALMERAEVRLKVRPAPTAVTAALGSTAAASTISSNPRHVSIQSPPKPWSRYR